MGISPTDMPRDQPQLKVRTGDIGPNGRYKMLAMKSWAQYSMAILDFMGFRMFFRMVFLFFYRVTFPDHLLAHSRSKAILGKGREVDAELWRRGGKGAKGAQNIVGTSLKGT